MSSTTKVITPTATLSYPHLDEPQPAQQGGKPKYSCALVFAPGTDLKALEAAAIAAAEAKWPGKATEMLRKGQIRVPFRKDAEAKGYPEGSVFLNVRADQQPGIVYAHAETGTNKPARMAQENIRKEMYAGAQVKASLSAFGYDTNGNRGVSFGLNNLQKIAEGARLDGRAAAENEFEVDLSAAPADISTLV